MRTQPSKLQIEIDGEDIEIAAGAEGSMVPDSPVAIQVAEVVGVRPIRLKELEEGLKHPEGLETLGKVLQVYRVRLDVVMPTRQ
ncbi:hypothetical protein [Streptomyces sp. NPDC003032]